MISRRRTLALMGAAFLPGTLRAAPQEPEVFAADVAAGRLPPVNERLPKVPRVIDMGSLGRTPGVQGGTVRTLIGGQRDIRIMPINGYARLVGYGPDLVLQPDILESCEVEEGRIFTFRLREGHRWSDGNPLTSEDFRFVWEDVYHDEELSPGGIPAEMLVAGDGPTFEVLDEVTVRYAWATPVPDFLPNLAKPSPLKLFLPSVYMKQFHPAYQTAEKLEEYIEQFRVDDWTSLFQKQSRQNRPENPDLPTTEPWRPRTSPPAEQFVFERNPYFHRVDEAGTQLPYIDRVLLNISSSEIIPAKAATGEADLQYMGLSFNDYTLLKRAERVQPVKVDLWKQPQGSKMALLPNLNCADPVWRAVLQDANFRRGLSLAVDREEINKALFFGLARESADTVLPESPLYREEYASAYAAFDPEKANALLDLAGLDKRDRFGMRKLPDGRPVQIVVESAGESTLETDILELIHDTFFDVGVAIYTRTSQRELLRSRAMGGGLLMSVGIGLDNAVPTADMPPLELAPTDDAQLQWPNWGMFFMSAESSGVPPDLAPVVDLMQLLRQWRRSASTDERAEIWHRMLAIRADQVFTIGTVNGALAPLVRADWLKNVPDEGLLGYDPTSYLGAYMPDTFWDGRRG
ncbi:ABC transporter substrate-binding protein [Oceaniglobus roseus]|uniref:ABC transporter substrate-binding protein n=1 Tax=Oceaniglobus roseus TaxID=1737570 RepID=UPI000C7F15A9|nr:ABC transporter substrate-binding protein [Kandeliimicrobium roseum]